MYHELIVNKVSQTTERDENGVTRIVPEPILKVDYRRIVDGKRGVWTLSKEFLPENIFTIKADFYRELDEDADDSEREDFYNWEFLVNREPGIHTYYWENYCRESSLSDVASLLKANISNYTLALGISLKVDEKDAERLASMVSDFYQRGGTVVAGGTTKSRVVWTLTNLCLFPAISALMILPTIRSYFSVPLIDTSLDGTINNLVKLSNDLRATNSSTNSPLALAYVLYSARNKDPFFFEKESHTFMSSFSGPSSMGEYSTHTSSILSFMDKYEIKYPFTSWLLTLRKTRDDGNLATTLLKRLETK